ncbi:MAG: hypothetical protein ACTSQZ_09720 [Candidatus Thorarchaeota archaeon]
MTVVIYIVPYHFVIAPRANSIMSILWKWGIIHRSNTVSFQFYGPAEWFHPILILNYLFVIWMVRLYQAKTTAKKPILLGLLSAPIILFELVYLLPNLWDPNWWWTVRDLFDYPLPLHAFIAMIFIKLFPPPEKPSVWIEEELANKADNESWWDRSDPKLRDEH